MFLREDLNLTISDVDSAMRTAVATTNFRVAPGDLRVDLTGADPEIRLGNAQSAPATIENLLRIGKVLQIPSAFMKRMDSKMSRAVQQQMLNEMLANTLTSDVRVSVSGEHIADDIADWSKNRGIQPSDLLAVAANILGNDAPVARLVNTSDFFGFDVYAPEGFENGYGGEGVTPYADGNVKDDITAGGLRFGMNTRQGLAPYVQEWLFRLACTNGYEVERPGLKVDARGSTPDEVLHDLTRMANLAFLNVGSDISAFYELRNTPVDNPERTIRQIARERSIPDRSTMALIDLAAGEDLPDDASMFDVVNLITNYANSPSVHNDGGRLLLERAGGAAISDHASRCGHCTQKVGG